ncbi:hypothetical protein D3C71_1326430 [compost metagenome]
MRRRVLADIAVSHVDHQPLDIRPGDVRDLHVPDPGIDMPLDANAVDLKRRRLLGRRSFLHVEFAQFPDRHLRAALGFDPLRVAAHSRPRQRATRFLARLFSRQDLAGRQRQHPPRAADRPVSHDVGFPALRRDPHAETLQLDIPRQIPLWARHQGIHGPFGQFHGHHMVTRHVASVPPQQVLSAHSGHHMVTSREQIGG